MTYREIQLTKNKVALVDDSDFEYLNQWKWWALKCEHSYYAARTDNNKKNILMHRLILGISDSKIEVDHKDHNGLNNQRFNLRAATRSQNNANRNPAKNKTSNFRGVSWNIKDKRWSAHITKNRISFYLGNFKNEFDAAKAYNKAAIEKHGEFANLNDT